MLDLRQVSSDAFDQKLSELTTKRLDEHRYRATFRKVREQGSGNFPPDLNMAMDFETLTFGSITIDGMVYEHDVIIDRGKIRKRKKKPSKKFREQFGHTPVSVEEAIPWKCRNLVIGTGRYGSLPVMDEVKREARQRGVALLIVPTEEALQTLATKSKNTNAILHVTC